ncbi:MAG: hypothetical protein KAT16_02885 [Candidatus Heimdallarchaeota archaeon]|nr:hypothetical protein [Candidatus Heimdallarchaeota archaeon]
MKALNMLYSRPKHLNLSKIVIIIGLLSFWGFTVASTNAVVTADWGDVVDVHYFRYTNPDYTGIAEDNEITHIYLSQDSTVPADVAALFPDTGISAAYFSDFKTGIIGLSLNEQNQFTALEGGQYYYFLVTLLRIRYDAIIDGSTTTTTTTTTTTSVTKNPLDDLILFGGGGTIIAGGILLWAFVSSRRRDQAINRDSTSVSRQEKSIKQKKTKLKELRELAESRDPSTGVEEPAKSDVKFRRRR